MTSQEMSALCAQALSTRLGIRVELAAAVERPADAFRQQFYAFRAAQRKLGPTELDLLAIHVASPTEAWIVRLAQPEASDA